MSSTDSSSALSLGWNSPTLPAAIGISIGAGLATAVGGAFAFLPGVWRALPQTTVLAISLALSAGVMLYVSFIEIFSKSHDAILASGVSEAAATGITTLCFFLGMGLTVLLELLVHVIFERRNAGCADAPSDLPTEICACHMDLEADEGGLPVLVHDNKEAVPPHHAHQHAHHHSHVQCTTNSMECAPAAAAGERTHPTPPSSNAAAAPIFVPSSSVQPSELQRIDEASVMVEMLSAPTHVSRTSSRNGEATPGTAEDSDHVALNSPEEKKRLARMGMMTALAIAIHNFPEGLATFLATLADAHVCSASTDPASALPSPAMRKSRMAWHVRHLSVISFNTANKSCCRGCRWAVARDRELSNPFHPSAFCQAAIPPCHQAAHPPNHYSLPIFRRSVPRSAWPLLFTTSLRGCALRCPSTMQRSPSGRHLAGPCSQG